MGTSRLYGQVWHKPFEIFGTDVRNSRLLRPLEARAITIRSNYWVYDSPVHVQRHRKENIGGGDLQILPSAVAHGREMTRITSVKKTGKRRSQLTISRNESDTVIVITSSKSTVLDSHPTPEKKRITKQTGRVYKVSSGAADSSKTFP